jgi:hypothetical protein
MLVDTGCYLDERSSEELIVNFRQPEQVRTRARDWSMFYRDLEFEAVVTRIDRTRQRIRYVAGAHIASWEGVVSDQEVCDAFGDARVYPLCFQTEMSAVY